MMVSYKGYKECAESLLNKGAGVDLTNKVKACSVTSNHYIWHVPFCTKGIVEWLVV